MGYVSCIINDIIPEEKVEYYIQNENLIIHLLKNELDVSTKEKLVHRLKETKFFKYVEIKNPESKTNSTPPKDAMVVEPQSSVSTLKLLPAGVLYDSPIADPKWPKFSAGYQRHLKKIYGKDIFSLSFGENLALLRYSNNSWSYELGAQAGLFGLMDIGSNPTRLINSDYFIGAGLSIVYERKWQNLIQFAHTSCHLGDEFLISRPDYLKKRINLSYEYLKWYTAYKFKTIRPYIGIAYLVHRDPSSLKPLTLEVGVDYVSEAKFMFDTTHYILGVHTHHWSENNFKQSLNIRTGLQLDNPVWGGRHLQFMIDYSVGKSRHGQFFKKNEHYIGLLVAISS